MNKGFYDMGDIVYLLDPGLCSQEIVKAPTMDEYMFFNQEYTNGKMVRVYDIDNNASWNLLFDGMARFEAAAGGKSCCFCRRMCFYRFSRTHAANSSSVPCGYFSMLSPVLLIRQSVTRYTCMPSFPATMSSPTSLPTIRQFSG